MRETVGIGYRVRWMLFQNALWDILQGGVGVSVGKEVTDSFALNAAIQKTI